VARRRDQPQRHRQREEQREHQARPRRYRDQPDDESCGSGDHLRSHDKAGPGAPSEQPLVGAGGVRGDAEEEHDGRDGPRAAEFGHPHIGLEKAVVRRC
jgi:hypothetical protein